MKFEQEHHSFLLMTNCYLHSFPSLIWCYTIRYMMMLWYHFSSTANWFDKVIFSIFVDRWPMTIVFVFKVYWGVIHLLQCRLPDGPQLKKSQCYTIVKYNTIQLFLQNKHKFRKWQWLFPDKSADSILMKHSRGILTVLCHI